MCLPMSLDFLHIINQAAAICVCPLLLARHKFGRVWAGLCKDK